MTFEPPPRLVAIALADWTDPAVIFAGGPATHSHAFWLDAGATAAAGHSYLGLGEPIEVGPVLAIGLRAGLGAGPRAGEPAAASTGGAAHLPAGVGAFRGGYVGWFGYEWGAQYAGLGAEPEAATGPEPDLATHPVPPAAWLRVHEYVAFDHAARQVWVVAPAERVEAWAEQVDAWGSAGVGAASIGLAQAPERVATSAHSAQEHADLIRACHAVIRAGDAYQLCLTTQFTVPAGAVPFEGPQVFTALRASSPSHHSGYIRTGDTTLLSASPEQFLGVADGRVQTKPIKGTRPRGIDAETDAALALELRASTKEQAENVMIVDLMRNDLTRVCEPGSVRVDALLDVESYAQVHQLVSTVSGALRPGISVSDLLAATFPAGSMTGAPKRSAMAHLRGLERAPRGVYAGCWGYVGFDGTVDLAMVIRTIMLQGDVASVGSGGGITSGSVVAEEVHEVGVKVRAPLAALGAAVPEGW